MRWNSLVFEDKLIYRYHFISKKLGEANYAFSIMFQSYLVLLKLNYGEQLTNSIIYCFLKKKEAKNYELSSS